ncbi:hypothetical protein KC363_g4392 [Hortaea werneckii]|nr:hypothetical protein KC325_g6948 [Hortaea werneckii]KAI6989095.1 hypothetical protein KC359_g7419 [Hortaea werneckii]KAI7142779.1 hypothetical protein KC344_g6903 [Hortaea werneckii]KAI7170178.1 hypothetical protein KC360_g7024 [Hortaea werneckii]KAI7190428.1 hypothetical protein KC363_g4392 [Hortaea werneckii]
MQTQCPFHAMDVGSYKTVRTCPTNVTLFVPCNTAVGYRRQVLISTLNYTCAHSKMTAASQVFTVPELLELVLQHIDYFQLYRLQRTNTLFRNVIRDSRRLRQKMFLDTQEDSTELLINPLLPSDNPLPQVPQQLLDWWSNHLRLSMPVVCLYYAPSPNGFQHTRNTPAGFWITYTYRVLAKLKRLRRRNASWRRMTIMTCPSKVAVWLGPDVNDYWSIEGGRQWSMGELMDHIWSQGDLMMKRIEKRTQEIEAEKDRAATRRNQYEHSDCIIM